MYSNLSFGGGFGELNNGVGGKSLDGEGFTTNSIIQFSYNVKYVCNIKYILHTLYYRCTLHLYRVVITNNHITDGIHGIQTCICQYNGCTRHVSDHRNGSF